jgi:hypothetical protein
MEAPVMASAVLAVGGPFWGENGHLCQGIGNDPRKLRGMLRRLDLPGWNDPAGVEANPGRWDAIRGARMRVCPCLPRGMPSYQVSYCVCRGA